LHEQLPTPLEEARDLVHDEGREHQPLLVALLPPRIGEVSEHTANAAIWAQARKNEAGVFREDACAGAHAELAELRVDDRSPLAANLEPEDGDVRLRLHALQDEPSSPWTELDFGPLPANDVAHVHPFAVGQSWRVGVGARRWTRRRRWFHDDEHSTVVGLNRIARHFPLAPIVVVTAILAWRTLRAVLAQVGEPCAAIDDAFIHFQYARAIAELHPFRYAPGMPPTSGATSLLWPTMLAPFYAIGFRGNAIVWPAWILGFAALAALANEAYHLARPLAGRWGAVASAAMVLCFSAFTWCAASGMEVVPFAWAMARSARRASEYAEDETHRTPRHRWELVGMAFVTALLRPEGALVAVAIAVVLALYGAGWRPRAVSIAALGGAMATPVILWIFTGSARANTAAAKLLIGNPYYSGSVLVSAVGENLKTLFKTLLNGQIWSAEFLPTNAMPVAVMSLFAVPIVAVQKRRYVRGLFILGIALGICIPCFYVTFLWNRLRYLWPFATGWLVALACLGAVLGDVVTLIHPRARAGVPMLLGVFAGAFAVRLDWVIDDVANSASGIDRQHVKIGRWAHDNLPDDALVAVNDTGAIAYFSNRRTFDIVGLTTNGEAPYWVAGTASRLEHYERMPRASLPTHFIVYPEWMGTSAFFGERLFDATVTDSTILGGQSMRAYVADWSLLHSGDEPWSERADVIDAVDVADLESEHEHHFELLAHDNEEVVGDGYAPTGERVIDGGRGYRRLDRFVARLRPGATTWGVARVASMKGKATLDVRLGREVIASFTIGTDDDVASPEWTEQAFIVSADLAKEETPLEVAAREGLFASYHYWFVTAARK
jgi:hypothetical protein